MIRMIQSRSAGHAKAYFSDALLKSDYYTNDQEMPGLWQGKLAARLGMEGTANKHEFFALCENIHPTTGKPLTPRMREDRTTGYDINFHCPKSVSVLHMVSNDDHILTAFQESVTETMKGIEADSKTRVRQKGVNEDRTTGELAWAQFIHQTARPVEGQSPDPHLHSHCFVFNATWDDTEQKFKAGQFRDIKRDMPFYQAQFHKTFSDKLIGLGYQVQVTDKSFEIENVPKKVIDLFSKRTDEIGRIAKEQGITDAKEKSELGARTRSKKQKGISMAELKTTWRAQIAALGTDVQGEGDKAVRYAPAKAVPSTSISAQQCVDYALEHCFERSSALQDRRILQHAYKFGLGNVSVSAADITACFNADDRIIHIQDRSQTLCTTKEVLLEEKRMVELAKNGQGKMIPLYQEAPDIGLSGQQKAAVAHVLTTSHRVSIIRGAAGAGKTTLMKEAREHIEKAGKNITVVAPTAQASRGVLRDEGFSEANTVALLLMDTKMQDNLKDQVLWVDEAGLLGTKDMKALLELTTKQNAMLILGGDTRQHASVIRGDALRILNTVGGIQTAEVSKIYRQQNKEYKSTVEDLSKGDVPAAFRKLDAMGFIKIINPLEPNKMLVDDVMETIKAGKTALVIAPTHAQGEEVTKDIRARMRSKGMIGKKEITIPRFSNISFTEAEKKDARNFEQGMLIQFNQNAPGFKRGSIWVVDSIDGDNIKIKNAEGEIKRLPLGVSDRYEVFLQKDIQLSKGDLVRITRNGFDENKKRLDNGDMLQVVKVSKNGHITLRNVKSNITYHLDQNYGHITHAHCITSHVSQGKNVDEVFISQPAATFCATNAKQFYVSVSRGKERARIYTDDKEELLHHASELDERQSAIELVNSGKAKQKAVRQSPREEEKPKDIKPVIKSKFLEKYGPDI